MAYNKELAGRVQSQLDEVPGVVEKKMFGGVGYLLRGNMACGVNGENLIVRLPADQHESALLEPGVRTFDMTGRPMKGWIMVGPEAWKSETDLRRWIMRGVEYANTLPPK
jgi:hypothetical protein